LKDQKRAAVVGEKSFGSGADQKAIQLKSGAVLILSTAKHYTPSGKVIQDEAARNGGILPDLVAPDDETRQDLAVESYYDDKGDVSGVDKVGAQPENGSPALDDKDEAAKYKQFQEKNRQNPDRKSLEVLSNRMCP